MLMKIINRKREARRKRKILERKIVQVACDNETGVIYLHGVYIGNLSKWHLSLLLHQFMSCAAECRSSDKIFRNLENIEN